MARRPNSRVKSAPSLTPQVANVGDTRAVLVSRDGTRRCTTDHNLACAQLPNGGPSTAERDGRREDSVQGSFLGNHALKHPRGRKIHIAYQLFSIQRSRAFSVQLYSLLPSRLPCTTARRGQARERTAGCGARRWQHPEGGVLARLCRRTRAGPEQGPGPCKIRTGNARRSTTWNKTQRSLEHVAKSLQKINVKQHQIE